MSSPTQLYFYPRYRVICTKPDMHEMDVFYGHNTVANLSPTADENLGTLFTAAPEMLEALKGVLTYLDPSMGSLTPKADAKARAELIRVIAKAEGRA